jgi:hypothetical protein
MNFNISKSIYHTGINFTLNQTIQSIYNSRLIPFIKTRIKGQLSHFYKCYILNNKV